LPAAVLVLVDLTAGEPFVKDPLSGLATLRRPSHAAGP
jgi:hypothetical protein